MFSTTACIARSTAISRQLSLTPPQNELDHGAVEAAAGQCMVSN
jgi:hypothetical protein